MASPHDLRNEQSALVHIQAAKAAPHRKELELNQAENFVRLIMDRTIHQRLTEEILKARRAR
jgi:hypothetical protein